MSEVAGGPEIGHTFRFTVEIRGSSRVWTEGEEPGPHEDDEDFSGPPWTLDVRAWSLSDACRKASELPLSAWDMSAQSVGALGAGRSDKAE